MDHYSFSISFVVILLHGTFSKVLYPCNIEADFYCACYVPLVSPFTSDLYQFVQFTVYESSLVLFFQFFMHGTLINHCAKSLCPSVVFVS